MASPTPAADVRGHSTALTQARGVGGLRPSCWGPQGADAVSEAKCDALVEKTPLWVHGHTHHSFDYQIDDGRIVYNPRRYYPRHLHKDFNPRLVVTV